MFPSNSHVSSLDFDFSPALDCKGENSLARQSQLEEKILSSTTNEENGKKHEEVHYTFSNFKSVNVTLTNSHETIDEMTNQDTYDSLMLTFIINNRQEIFTFENVTHVKVVSKLPMNQEALCYFNNCDSMDVNVHSVNTLVSYNECKKLKHQFKMGNILFKFNSHTEKEINSPIHFRFDFKANDDLKKHFSCECESIRKDKMDPKLTQKETSRKLRSDMRTKKLIREIKSANANSHSNWLILLLIPLVLLMVFSNCLSSHDLINLRQQIQQLKTSKQVNVSAKTTIYQEVRENDDPSQEFQFQSKQIKNGQKDNKLKEIIQCDYKGIQAILKRMSSALTAILNSFEYFSWEERKLFFGGTLKAYSKYFQNVMDEVKSFCPLVNNNFHPTNQHYESVDKCDFIKMEPLFKQLQYAFNALLNSWDSLNLQNFTQVLNSYTTHFHRLLGQIFSICKKIQIEDQEQEGKIIFQIDET